MSLRNLLTAAILLSSLTSASASGYARIPKLPKDVRGICLAIPSYRGIDAFLRFIESELVPRRVNVMVLRVDYGYQYASHPELVSRSKRREDTTRSVALSREEMKRIVKACQTHGITLVPLVNLLGHQSWAGNLGALLRAYPEFDETPWVQLPSEYKWPNADSLYCKSYCPNHPGVHRVVFDLVDEI
ncbi:MAG: glycoside hydrolase, partial [Chitinophagia bacterium]|nr:glycoside hydrolase [Chitinophagia bacterium]